MKQSQGGDFKITPLNGQTSHVREPLIVAVIPAYDEEATISKVVMQAKMCVNRVIVCDDGSTDMTCKIVKKLGVQLTSHRKNLGKGAALRTLFAKAREINADIVVTLDADGQHSPQEIPRLIKAMRIDNADIVVGSRFIKTSDNNTNVPIYRALGNKILNTLVDRRLTDTQSGFRAYNKAAIASLMPTDNGMGADSEILIKAKELGLKVIETPIKVEYNVPKPSKQNFLFQTAQVFVSTLKHHPVRESKFLYTVNAVFALLVALGTWIFVFDTFTKTRQITTSLVFIATGATVIGTLLLAMAVRLLSPPKLEEGQQPEKNCF